MTHNHPLQSDHFNFIDENNHLFPETNFQEECSSSNTNYGYNNDLPMMNNNSMSYVGAISNQQQMAGSNASIQLCPPSYGSRYTGHANTSEEQNPSLSTNYTSLLNMATNPPPQSNPGIFKFEIPGFRIIVIPISSIENLNVQEDQYYMDNSFPNINANNSQPQFQQSYNYNNF
ncbi:14189_t:CDS:1 [Funneliformis mosseae]|uniref:14189_t:CDS:1 n=1 Tax=Funneliformis mosseae TaxID=27381 RepID=A0A9N9BEC1_FUNMO|nr:14189_t:CDS:1 [Funneliformis mosseae]